MTELQTESRISITLVFAVDLLSLRLLFPPKHFRGVKVDGSWKSGALWVNKPAEQTKTHAEHNYIVVDKAVI